MKQSEIKVGNRYTAKINNRVVAVTVKEITAASVRITSTGRRVPTRVRYNCFNEGTGRMVQIKSAAKFRAQLGQHISQIFK